MSAPHPKVALRKSLFWFQADTSFFGYKKGSVVRRARNKLHDDKQSRVNFIVFQE